MKGMLDHLCEGGGAWALSECCYDRRQQPDLYPRSFHHKVSLLVQSGNSYRIGFSNTQMSDCLGIIVAAGLCISHAVCCITCIVLYQCIFTNEHCKLLMLQAAIRGVCIERGICTIPMQGSVALMVPSVLRAGRPCNAVMHHHIFRSFCLCCFVLHISLQHIHVPGM